MVSFWLGGSAAAKPVLFDVIMLEWRLITFPDIFPFKPYPHKSPFPYGQTLEIPPAPTLSSTQAAPAEPERAPCARTLSAHPVPLLFLPEGMQGMSLFGIFRAKVTRPWEPSKGTCPIGHCAVGTLPAAFHPFRRPKARQKGGIPENFLRAPLFGCPRAT